MNRLWILFANNFLLIDYLINLLIVAVLTLSLHSNLVLQEIVTKVTYSFSLQKTTLTKGVSPNTDFILKVIHD